MYNLIAKPLEFFYGLIPNYAIAIALLTVSIMIVMLPLTLKGTRSMLAMQKLQPELKKLQNKHRDDRQKLNEEVMKFYKENNINPMSGCLPLLLQMPVFFILYRTLYQLLTRAPYGQDMGRAVSRSVSGVDNGTFPQFGFFFPKHLDKNSLLYQNLSQTSKMEAFGINLAQSAQKAFSQGFVKMAPYVVLVLLVTATSYYQQKQIAGRNPAAAAANPQQQMLMKIMPLFFAFISLTLPAGIVVYFLVSNVFRIGQQAFITRTMYRDEDGPLATSGREIDTPSTEKPKGVWAQLKEAGLPSPSQAKEDVRSGRATVPAGSKGKSSGSNGSSNGSGSKAKTPPKSAKATPAAKTSTNKSKASTSDADPAGSATKASPPSRTVSSPSRSAPDSGNRSKTKKKRK